MDDKKRFVLTEDHLKLLRAMFVSWDDCEFGAPAVDPKRPYGNSSVYEDMAEILGVVGEEMEDGYPCLSPAQCERLYDLHRETLDALQILLRHGDLLCGTYESSRYLGTWERVDA